MHHVCSLRYCMTHIMLGLHEINGFRVLLRFDAVQGRKLVRVLCNCDAISSANMPEFKCGFMRLAQAQRAKHFALNDGHADCVVFEAADDTWSSRGKFLPSLLPFLYPPSPPLPLLLQSTPLNETSISIDSDFLPIVKEVLGRVPETLAAQAAALDEADRQQQKQQQQAVGSASAAAGEGSSSSSSSSVPEDPLPGVPRPLAAAVDAALKLDDETLAAVSRAIMGRLDIVDLVGKNTAYEVAERVSALLLQAMSQVSLCLLRDTCHVTPAAVLLGTAAKLKWCLVPMYACNTALQSPATGWHAQNMFGTLQHILKLCLQPGMCRLWSLCWTLPQLTG
jgi:hypothetical protein